jgi:CTP synthase
MGQAKYVFVTGGVISGQGKGVVAASIGKLLNHDRKIVTVKCDGYLNVDPGTMNPTEHGEVFVLEDGAEVDLDFGHYERFLSIQCKNEHSVTSGKVFQALVERERKGEFLGKTVQVIPHVTGQIRDMWENIAQKENADVLLIEIGGTVGDIENLWFLEAAREVVQKKGKENVLFVHLGYIPEVDESFQQKTKPMQLSIMMLRERGIFPDILVGRTKRELDEKTKLKLHWLCNVEMNAILSDPDLQYTYELPLLFEREGVSDVLKNKFGFDHLSDLTKWRQLVDNLKNPKHELSIAICGKYTEVVDSYISIQESLRHAGAKLSAKVNAKWIETTHLEQYDEGKIRQLLEGCAGVIVPGGFGSRGTEGKINIVRYCREHDIPFLGICYGLQLATIEFARNVCGLQGANSTEIEPNTPHKIIDILEEQKKVTHKGGTMRLGGHPAILAEGSLVSKLYNSNKASERHRHRYEVNPAYHDILQKHGLRLSGMSPDGSLVEFIELPQHKYFVGTQAHPELKSTLENPAPLFVGLVQACLK